MTKTDVLAWLRKQGTQHTKDGMARYGIVAKRAYGVPMSTLLLMKKRAGKDHALSLALWDTGWYEARLLAALVGDPALVTRRQMDTWAQGFENWADCDTVCFHLFDRSPFAWGKARQWAKSPREFVKRGGFALMACLALHDKAAPDRDYLALLPLIEKGAQDERNFVKKGVNWALRGIGSRNLALHTASIALARKLAADEAAAPRWVGKDALRQLASAATMRRVKRHSGADA
jgi:3-methyladenine DNA glycosylase AlkD